MDTMLMYLLAFLAGFLACDLVRALRQRQIAHMLADDAPAALIDPADMACREWSANPSLWCNRPGCPRCFDLWGRP
ncbi:hypothetical protein AB0L44_26045 [Nonomuraea wenchangensis]|uniref:hypothetical protein n=1 Tax=Nonomuraea wenchangensis TaxID=568860 RepID=UPI00343BB0A1